MSKYKTTAFILLSAIVVLVVEGADSAVKNTTGTVSGKAEDGIKDLDTAAGNVLWVTGVGLPRPRSGKARGYLRGLRPNNRGGSGITYGGYPMNRMSGGPKYSSYPYPVYVGGPGIYNGVGYAYGADTGFNAYGTVNSVGSAYGVSGMSSTHGGRSGIGMSSTKAGNAGVSMGSTNVGTNGMGMGTANIGVGRGMSSTYVGSSGIVKGSADGSIGGMGIGSTNAGNVGVGRNYGSNGNSGLVSLYSVGGYPHGADRYVTGGGHFGIVGIEPADYADLGGYNGPGHNPLLTLIYEDYGVHAIEGHK